MWHAGLNNLIKKTWGSRYPNILIGDGEHEALKEWFLHSRVVGFEKEEAFTLLALESQSEWTPHAIGVMKSEPMASAASSYPEWGHLQVISLYTGLYLRKGHFCPFLQGHAPPVLI